MKQAKLLQSISKLTPYQSRKMDQYIIYALKPNEAAENKKPEQCPYCKENSRMIKKRFHHGKQHYQ